MDRCVGGKDQLCQKLKDKKVPHTIYAKYINDLLTTTFRSTWPSSGFLFPMKVMLTEMLLLINNWYILHRYCVGPFWILCYLLLKYYHCFTFYWLNLCCCCCCCHSHLTVKWIRVNVFTDLKFDDPHHVWESCAEVLYICISLQLI